MIATGAPENDMDGAKRALSLYTSELPEAAPLAIVTARAEPTSETGYIYFVTCDCPNFPIKIGWSRDLRLRAIGLQSGLPYKLMTLLTYPGTLSQERDLHIGFNRYRLEGEWFERAQELMSFIDRQRETVKHLDYVSAYPERVA